MRPRELTALPEPGPARNALDAARAIVAEPRREEAEARNAIDRRPVKASPGARAYRRSLSKCGRGAGAPTARPGSVPFCASAAARSRAKSPRSPPDRRRSPQQTEALGGEISAAAHHCRQTADRLARGESRLREAGERRASRRSRSAETREAAPGWRCRARAPDKPWPGSPARSASGSTSRPTRCADLAGLARPGAGRRGCNRGAARAPGARARRHRPDQPGCRERGRRARRPHRWLGARTRRSERGDRQAAARRRSTRPGGPAAARGRFRAGQPAFWRALRQAVRRRQGASWR